MQMSKWANESGTHFSFIQFVGAVSFADVDIPFITSDIQALCARVNGMNNTDNDVNVRVLSEKLPNSSSRLTVLPSANHIIHISMHVRNARARVISQSFFCEFVEWDVGM